MIIWDVERPITFLSELDNQSHTVTHELAAPTGYSIVKAMLVVAFSDGYWHPDRPGEKFHLTADGVDQLYEGHMNGTHRWGFQYMPFLLGQASIDSLNSTGELAVTIKALDTLNGVNNCQRQHACANDFWWKKSILVAKVTEVPEPGMLGLLGLGLLGVGTARWLRKA
jgi:hypothetical protein